MNTSALVKLVIEEIGSAKLRKKVREVLTQGLSVNASDIVLSEVLNALWKYRALI